MCIAKNKHRLPQSSYEAFTERNTRETVKCIKYDMQGHLRPTYSLMLSEVDTNLRS